MDKDEVTQLPQIGVDADLAEQINDATLRRLMQAASGLSTESQQYLADLALRLRVTEGLTPRAEVAGL